MGKKCAICKKKCSGDIIKADGDKYFHFDCFKCNTCQCPLSTSGFYKTKDGYVCPRHYQQSAATTPTPAPTTATIDKKAVAAAAAAAKPLSIHVDASKGPPSLGSPTTCAACGDTLQSGQVLLALNQSWHVWCFKCSECAAVLQGEYMAHGGEPLCLRDYNLKYGVKCYECERYIAGRVLEAGGYKFHPTCARCSRCGNHFDAGQEMFMQGTEIWHPACTHYQTTENIVGKKTRDVRPLYQAGKHLTYLYLLPESDQTCLKHPISPHPPQPVQFHTPMAPIKIRKSRLSMLKTGMQRLTEDLDRNQPRAKSPHMDNEEPIEMAHYPGGHVPDPGEIPAIEREDFPAPPYPYAVEELKRRLSSSSIENDDEEEEALYADKTRQHEEKVKKNMEALDQIDKDSSIAHVIKQNLEESFSVQKQQLPLHWDPRSSSRTPSAKKMPHHKFRYDTPINASPSRHLNRPKPWVFWMDGDPMDRAATTTIPCFHLPPSRGGTLGGNDRAVTLPDGYGYYTNGYSRDSTIGSRFSDHSLTAASTTLPSSPQRGGGGGGGGDIRTNMRSSLPDMNKPVRVYPLEQLITSNQALPEDVDRQHLERHLPREEFEQLFQMSPIEFYKLPEWKRINLKRKHKLF